MIYEVELKYILSNREELFEKLNSLQAKKIETVSQSDTYFNHPSRDFAQTDEAVRVRITNDNTILTYKGPKIDAITKTRKELEISLASEKNNSHKIEEFLVSVGFQRVHTVKKKRECWKLNWEEHSVDFAFDDVEELGQFVEIEMQADDDTLTKTRESLLRLATALGLENPTMQSYLELLLES